MKSRIIVKGRNMTRKKFDIKYQDTSETKSRILADYPGSQFVSCVIPDETIPQMLEDRIVHECRC